MTHSSRAQRQKRTQDVLALLDAAQYTLGDQTVSLELDALVSGTRVLQSLPPVRCGPERPWPKVSVMGATSTQAVHRAPAGARVTVLNFASGTRVGGGFLTGSLAQEEDLCRTSTLFSSLSCDAARPFYEAGRAAGIMGADAAVLSPGVLFFLDEHGQPISPRRANIISCAAPNLREFPGDPARQCEAGERIRVRTRLVLRAAEELGTDHLILGAWGCGVFANDPAVVAPAMLFALGDHLKNDDSTFAEVTFAIPEPRAEGPDNLTTFLEAVVAYGGPARESLG
ncbi:TIGR02452 family protein [Deinococcus sp. Arct2-2]|uniref:TIGR02452 family protein n=1 Tax=Deinococcus sp. Arct2-2 TaxID=2568653 RepID=UPI001454D3A6|nr:TIGR02452 family protein [Deinococcus sp. Arct2-2]